MKRARRHRWIFDLIRRSTMLPNTIAGPSLLPPLRSDRTGHQRIDFAKTSSYGLRFEQMLKYAIELPQPP